MSYGAAYAHSDEHRAVLSICPARIARLGWRLRKGQHDPVARRYRHMALSRSLTGPEGSLVTKAQIAAAIQTIVRLQLDDCKRAIKDGTKSIALNELEDATRKLKLLVKHLEA